MVLVREDGLEWGTELFMLCSSLFSHMMCNSSMNQSTLWPGVFPRGAGGLLGQEGRVAVDALNVADGHGNSVLFELSAIKKANCLPV